MIKFYGYKRCGTCRKGEQHLEAKGKEYRFIDITEAPPSLSELKKLYKSSGLELKAFYNTSGVLYREMNIKEKRDSMSEAEQLELLAAHGKLIKRPLISDGKQCTVGFRDEVREKWN